MEDLAKYASVPVINGLTDFCHPCQVLADLMTVSEHKGALQGLKLCFVGDGNNMANSLIVGCMKVGMDVSIACPKGYQPDPHVVALAETLPAKLTITEDLKLEAEAGNYQAALGVYEKLMRRWDKHLTVLSIFLIHDEVDNVSEELENIGAQLREENELLLPSSIARLTYYLGHIRDGDAFCVENIF